MMSFKKIRFRIKELWKLISEKVEKFIIENKLILGLAIFFAVFHPYLERIISRFLVEPIFSVAEQSNALDILFLLGFATIFFLFLKRSLRNYVYSLKTFFYSLTTLVFFLYYRFCKKEVWDFTSFQNFESIKYLDVIFSYFLLNVIGYIINVLKPTYSKRLVPLLTRLASHFRKKDDSLKNEITFNEKIKGFYYDEPLGEGGVDLLERDNFAEKIANKILNTKSEKSSFAIGVSSKWGSGKTSFLDLLRKNIKKDEGNNIIVNFNPWLNNGTHSIIQDFFKAFSSAIKPYHSSLAIDFKKYADILISLDNENLSKFIKPIDRVFYDNKSAKEEFDNINSIISKINVQIIVFIDDLDRLYKEEIIEVIRIIRNSANFAKTIFIAAYDREYVINAIKDINNYKSDYFLEKIFQLEIPLPQFEHEIIKNRLIKLISPNLLEVHKTELNELLTKSDRPYGNNFFDFKILNTLRDATRFANSFLISYESLMDDIILNDLLNLELLRTKYPDVYNLIYNKRDNYLELDTSSFLKHSFVLKKDENKDPTIGKDLKEYPDSNEIIELLSYL